MKILIEMGESAAFHYRLGWVNAFTSLGHLVYYWNYQNKPAFDVFSEFEPDIFIGTTWNLNRAIIKCILARPELKVLLSAPNFGEMDTDIDPEDTVQFATEKEKDWVKLLKDITGKPDYVMTYYHENWVGVTHNNWISFGVTPVGIPMAADVILYPIGKYNPNFACDISFVGNYWKYKGVNLDKYLVTYSHPISPYSVRIYGRGWPVHTCLGEISNQNLGLVKDIFASSKVCPAIYEPLSAKYGFDVSERIFKICSSGGFCISENVASLTEDFNVKGVPLFNNEVAYLELIHQYSSDEFEQYRKDCIKASTNWVYRKNTYWHRARQMLEVLGFKEESDKAEKFANDYYQGLNLV